MSELVACARCQCLVHESRILADVKITVSIAEEVEHKTGAGSLCRDCFRNFAAMVSDMAASRRTAIAPVTEDTQHGNS